VALFEDIAAAFAADTCHGAFEWVVGWVAAVWGKEEGGPGGGGGGTGGGEDFAEVFLVEGHVLEVVVMGVVMGTSV